MQCKRCIGRYKGFHCIKLIQLRLRRTEVISLCCLGTDGQGSLMLKFQGRHALSERDSETRAKAEHPLVFLVVGEKRHVAGSISLSRSHEAFTLRELLKRPLRTVGYSSCLRPVVITSALCLTTSQCWSAVQSGRPHTHLPPAADGRPVSRRRNLAPHFPPHMQGNLDATKQDHTSHFLR